MDTQHHNDREQLAAFVRDVADVLKRITNGELVSISTYHRAHMRDAWAEFSEHATVNHIVDQLTGNNAVPDEALRSVGLLGSQLAFKLHGFNRWKNKLDDIADNILNAISAESIVRKLLRWANILLKSLASAIPGADPLVEMKDAYEAAMDDDE